MKNVFGVPTRPIVIYLLAVIAHPVLFWILGGKLDYGWMIPVGMVGEFLLVYWILKKVPLDQKPYRLIYSACIPVGWILIVFLNKGSIDLYAWSVPILYVKTWFAARVFKSA